MQQLETGVGGRCANLKRHEMGARERVISRQLRAGGGGRPMSVGTPGLLRDPLAEPPVGAAERAYGRSPAQLFWRRFRRDRVALVALAVVDRADASSRCWRRWC